MQMPSTLCTINLDAQSLKSPARVWMLGASSSAASSWMESALNWLSLLKNSSPGFSTLFVAEQPLDLPDFSLFFPSLPLIIKRSSLLRSSRWKLLNKSLDYVDRTC